jgi:proteic killer suppression protein
MKITSANDKRIRALVEKPDLTKVKGFDKREVRKVSDMIAAIRVADHPRQLMTIESWKAHELKLRFPGKWSLWVTGNWRLTFWFDAEAGEASGLDYEDYH